MAASRSDAAATVGLAAAMRRVIKQKQIDCMVTLATEA